ncbi:GNAT family N-acetyltransferase [Halomonas sp. GXIMD04776]|uniref:GNAT family N-acetyltransferase n=1 Tax=Halomonas sp. GXIMD04776 TaxID=3415605 RepID=UPI003C9BDC13
MLERMVYRAAVPKDAADQGEVFYHAVMQGAAGCYTQAQREAWVSALPREASAWAARQMLYPTLVAVCDRRCVGFVELDLEGARIETLYVWPSLARRGIGSRLLDYAEVAMREEGVTRLRIEASLVVSPGLEKRGWRPLGEEWVERQGQRLTRVRLEKTLT